MRVVEYKHSATHPYVIEGYRVNGERKRLFFRTRSDAKAELKRIKLKQRMGGDAGLAISDMLRAQAVEAQRKLEPYEKTIPEAVAFYLKPLGKSERSISVAALVSEYLAAKRRAAVSERHQEDLRQRLERFKDSFGSEPVRVPHSPPDRRLAPRARAFSTID